MSRFLVITKTDLRDVYDDLLEAEQVVNVYEDGKAHVRLPVFEEGEILVVDDLGREIGGAGRKPSKWWVSYEGFEELDKAIERAKKTLK